MRFYVTSLESNIIPQFYFSVVATFVVIVSVAAVDKFSLLPFE